MKAIIYNSDFDINKYNINDYVDLMNQGIIIAFNVMTAQFKAINNILTPISSEYEYIQDFCMDSNTDYLYYYRPADCDRTEVKDFLIKELNK